MSEQLRRHPDDLEALVARTAAARGLPAPYVEKDFWVTEVLRAAAADRTAAMPDGSTAPVTFLFKGGTSLSRVFGIVDRFSEDVDLLAMFPDGATGFAEMVEDINAHSADAGFSWSPRPEGSDDGGAARSSCIVAEVPGLVEIHQIELEHGNGHRIPA